MDMYVISVQLLQLPTAQLLLQLQQCSLTASVLLLSGPYLICRAQTVLGLECSPIVRCGVKQDKGKQGPKTLHWCHFGRPFSQNLLDHQFARNFFQQIISMSHSKCTFSWYSGATCKYPSPQISAYTIALRVSFLMMLPKVFMEVWVELSLC